MSKVYQNHSLYHGHLTSKEYVSALKCFEVSKTLLGNELSGVRCFRNLESEMSERENIIGALMQEDYSNFLTSEWHRPVDDHHGSNQVCDQDTLATIVCGLLRLDSFDFMEKFKEEACAAIRSTIKQTLIEVFAQHDDIDVSDRSEHSMFMKTLLLDHGSWMGMIRKLFDNIFNLLKRIEIVHNVITSAVREYSDSPKVVIEDVSKTVENCVNGSIERTQNCINEICDFAHERCAQLIEQKVGDGSLDRLSATDFTEFSSVIEVFVGRCERIFNRRSQHLKRVQQVQSNKFATRFHEERKKRIVHLLEIEQWKSIINVPLEFQTLCNNLVNSQELSEKKSSKILSSEKPAPFVTVKSEKYIVVNTVVTLITTMSDYCQTACELRPLAADILSRLLELLKFFGHKTSSLMYKGDAITIAGLKNITARNLANASRSLLLVISLIPSVKRIFLNLLNDSQVLMLGHFDEIIDLYRSVSGKIEEKMLSDVSRQIDRELSEWDAKPPVPSQQFQSVTKYLRILHNNLEDLPINELINIFQGVHKVFKEVLRSHLVRLKIAKDGGPQHG